MHTTKPRNIVLFSGGIDSTVVLRRSLQDGATMALLVNYGQPHVVELNAARRTCELLGVPFREVEVGPFQSMIPERAFYCPGRNTVFISLALSLAEEVGADQVWIGANFDDHLGYIDCRPGFFDAIKGVAEYLGVAIRTPLLWKTKEEIVQDAVLLGIDLSSTHTCYTPNGSEPCGSCPSCSLRQEAIRAVQG